MPSPNIEVGIYLTAKDGATCKIVGDPKALAKEVHPDRPGGDSEAMARLNRVCDKLKHSI